MTGIQRTTYIGHQLNWHTKIVEKIACSSQTLDTTQPDCVSLSALRPAVNPLTSCHSRFTHHSQLHHIPHHTNKPHSFSNSFTNKQKVKKTSTFSVFVEKKQPETVKVAQISLTQSHRIRIDQQFIAEAQLAIAYVHRGLLF